MICHDKNSHRCAATQVWLPSSVPSIAALHCSRCASISSCVTPVLQWGHSVNWDWTCCKFGWKLAGKMLDFTWGTTKNIPIKIKIPVTSHHRDIPMVSHHYPILHFSSAVPVNCCRFHHVIGASHPNKHEGNTLVIAWKQHWDLGKTHDLWRCYFPVNSPNSPGCTENQFGNLREMIYKRWSLHISICWRVYCSMCMHLWQKL